MPSHPFFKLFAACFIFAVVLHFNKEVAAATANPSQANGSRRKRHTAESQKGSLLFSACNRTNFRAESTASITATKRNANALKIAAGGDTRLPASPDGIFYMSPVIDELQKTFGDFSASSPSQLSGLRGLLADWLQRLHTAGRQNIDLDVDALLHSLEGPKEAAVLAFLQNLRAEDEKRGTRPGVLFYAPRAVLIEYALMSILDENSFVHVKKAHLPPCNAALAEIRDLPPLNALSVVLEELSNAECFEGEDCGNPSKLKPDSVAYTVLLDFGSQEEQSHVWAALINFLRHFNIDEGGFLFGTFHYEAYNAYRMLLLKARAANFEDEVTEEVNYEVKEKIKDISWLRRLKHGAIIGVFRREFNGCSENEATESLHSERILRRSSEAKRIAFFAYFIREMNIAPLVKEASVNEKKNVESYGSLRSAFLGVAASRQAFLAQYCDDFT